MDILTHLFGSEESIAKEMKLDDETIIKRWNDYLGTISKKKEIIGRLKIGSSLNTDLRELKRLLELELVDIHGEEKEEEELISDLEALEHSQRIKRVQRLEQCLAYAETKYEYAYGLLHQIYSILKMQMHMTEKLLAGSKDPENLISHFKLQFELECAVMKKILKIQTFHSLFSALVKGEHIIKTMDSAEKRLLKKMQDGMRKIFSRQITEGITYEWAMDVYNAVQDIAMDHETIIDMGYDPHSDIDFEYVNGPKFVDLVKENINRLKERDISEKMVNVFVYLFREWYNYERD